MIECRCENSGGRIDENQAARTEGLREDGTQNSREEKLIECDWSQPCLQTRDELYWEMAHTRRLCVWRSVCIELNIGCKSPEGSDWCRRHCRCEGEC